MEIDGCQIKNTTTAGDPYTFASLIKHLNKFESMMTKSTRVAAVAGLLVAASDPVLAFQPAGALRAPGVQSLSCCCCLISSVEMHFVTMRMRRITDEEGQAYAACTACVVCGCCWWRAYKMPLHSLSFSFSLPTTFALLHLRFLSLMSRTLFALFAADAGGKRWHC